MKNSMKNPNLKSNPIKSDQVQVESNVPMKNPSHVKSPSNHYQSHYFLVTELPSGKRLHFANRKITMVIKFGKSPSGKSP